MLNMVLLFIGTTEIIVIGGIALLVFGGKKLPELMRGLGKGVKEFKDGMREDNTPQEGQSASASSNTDKQATKESETEENPLEK
jgi:sec-independent protein translocase protein TatA